LAARSKHWRRFWQRSARLALLMLLCGAAPAAAEPSLAGQLLVATGENKDPHFAETILYLVKHSDAGAFGLILNKPIAKGSFSDVLKGFGLESKGATGEIVVHYGGPVGRQQGFVLHSDEFTLDSSIKIKDGIAMTADAKILQALALGTGPRQALLIMGYAGWAPGQLEAELRADAWFTISADKGLVFGRDTERKWRRAMDKRQIPL